jgi:hypothetical protein
MSFVGKLHNGAETFMKSQYYGDVLRPLDLCMRLDQDQQNHEQQQDGTTTLILQPPPPHNQHLNFQTEKKSGKTGEQNLMRNFSLTPSPSSSSSFENEEEMGCVGPPPFTLYRRNPAPVKVKNCYIPLHVLIYERSCSRSYPQNWEGGLSHLFLFLLLCHKLKFSE